MNKSKIKNTFIFFIVYMAYMSIYVARVNLSVAGPELKSTHILDAAQIGTLGSCFFVVFAIGRMLNGALSDIAPPWLMLTLGLSAAGLSNIFISFFPPYIAMLAFWIVNAYAQSMLWSSVLCTVSSLYDGNTVKKKTSLMVTSVATGNIMGIIINSYVITSLELRYAFIVPGIITIIFGILTFASTKNIKNSTANSEVAHTSLFKLIKSKELLTMDAAALMHGVMKENISLWMAVYIADTYFVDLSQSSMYILLIPIIGFAGRIAFPFLYKICKYNENTVSVIGFAVCAVLSAILCFGNIGMLAAALALGVIYMAASIINTSVVSIYPLSYAKTGNTASVSGILDFFTYLGAGVSGLIYGYVIKGFGYLPMFISWIIISVLSIIILSHKKK